MYTILIILVIALVVALLFVNIYFRVKVLKHYRQLVRAEVEFDLSHILNKDKLEKEVLNNYPDQKENIKNFIKHLKMSFRIALLIFVLICLFGWILMRFR